MTQDEIYSCAERAVRQMCAERGYTVRPYAGAWLISGDRFSLVVTSLPHVTASQLDAPWLLDDDEDEPLGVEALDGVVESYE